jgi:hypothetical protein
MLSTNIGVGQFIKVRYSGSNWIVKVQKWGVNATGKQFVMGDYVYPPVSGGTSKTIYKNCEFYIDQISKIEVADPSGTPFDTPEIVIGEHKVEFKGDGGVHVGCTFVETKTVDEIYNRLHAK